MTERRLIKLIFVYVPILCAIGLLISYRAGQRLFNPEAWIAEDSNSITGNARSRFSPWLDAGPKHATHVFEYDTRDLFPDVLLRFTVPETAEYAAYKSQLSGDSRMETVSAFPQMAQRHEDRVARWWSRQRGSTDRIGDHYFAFDDTNQTVYMMYVSPN